MLKSKKNHKEKIIENHETASWANITETKPVSKVPIPSRDETKNSKEWVDTNEK
ncbi:CDIF630_02480 family spore surface protein [Clostridium sp. JNZ X4-2]